jgi:hypothetical protein
MLMGRRTFTASGLLLVALVVAPVAAQDKVEGTKAVRQDRVIAGGPKEFMEVRHLVLAGTNEEIGRALATIARERFGTKPDASPDPLRTRVQRRYLEKNYPIHLDRMRGVAAAFGKRLDDDAWDFSSLGYLLHMPPGCSVIHLPPGLAADPGGVVSRNYEFSTGTMFGTLPPPGKLASTARPYLIEMHPDRGYPSLAMYSYDLLGGVLDGINSEGLTVALLADDELIEKYGLEPAGAAVGLEVTQVLRMLLDTCATAGEAQEALLLTKQYYGYIPVHYLVADRHGKAFVWEYSQKRNREYVVENPGKPLVTTNFSLHCRLEKNGPPSAGKVKDVCPRYCALAERLAAAKGPITAADLKETHKVADATRPGPKNRPLGRTLWHALYFPDGRKVRVSFYLRDEPDPAAAGKVKVVRSEYVEVALKAGAGGAR